jgi:sugar lactone lactonase YvrE
MVPDDPSWSLVSQAEFVVFDQKRAFEILGSAPTLTKMFDVLNVIHEGPVYVPEQNKLYVWQDGPPGNLSSLVIDLNQNPPTLSSFEMNPPTYQPNGAVLQDGKVILAVMGNNVSLGGDVKQRPAIAQFDPETLEVETLVDNYFGFFFSGPNDITVESNGDIWFTDSGILLPPFISRQFRLHSKYALTLGQTDYAFGIGLSNVSSQLQLLTYRFRPSTGLVSVVEDTLNHPNGIVFSPNGKTLYITDSGLESVGGPETTAGFYDYPIEILFTSTGKRNVYAFDVNKASSGSYLTNKRVIFQALEGAPDGIKVAKNGYLVVAAGLSMGVDILDASGVPLLRIQTTHPVENIAFTGEDRKTLWMVGIGGISKVEWSLVGI